jgi:hypothetical protein
MRRSALLLLPLLALPARGQELPPATGSNFGGVGLIEMRNARFRPDATLEAGAALRHQRRFWFVSFQALPFLETTFRVSERLDGTDGAGMETDRAFDAKLRLLEEGPWWPSLAIGLQDFIGTGIYSGEYIVGSKRWGAFDFSLGLGWGRLGLGADAANPFRALGDRFATRSRDVGRGGTLQADTYFRGEEIGVFGGVEVTLPPLPTPLGLVEGVRAKLELSSDTLRDERGGYPARQTNLRGEAETRLNAGLQWSNSWLDAGVFFVHGTDLLFRLSARLDPRQPPEAERPPPPLLPARPTAREERLAEAVFAALREAGFRPVGFGMAGTEARLAVSGGRFRTLPQVAGRVLRAVNGLLPPEARALRLTWYSAGVPIAELLVPRDILEAVLSGRASPEELWAQSLLSAPAGLDEAMLRAPGPGVDWGIEPRLALVLGDPTRTLRWQLALAAGARLELGAGFALAGSVQQALLGNLGDAAPSDSVLPRVRSDFGRYAEEGRTAIPALYAERIWTPARDIFARVTGGYLEPMFGGVSAELLWRPFDRPFAIGADLNWVRQRDFDQLGGFQSYETTTGHVSLYADLPLWDMFTILRAGRYLARDWGGTVELGRRFDSGIEVGAFATLTDVPFSQFGEGSFDKGIYVRIPLALFGRDTRSLGTALIRPVQRDGGQRVAVDNPLWEVTRDGRADAYRRGMSGFAR